MMTKACLVPCLHDKDATSIAAVQVGIRVLHVRVYSRRLYGAHVSQDVPEEVSGLSLMAVACGDRPPSSNGAAPAPQHAKYLLVLLFAMASRNRASFAKQPHHKVSTGGCWLQWLLQPRMARTVCCSG